jgi:hypothetical protein
VCFHSCTITVSYWTHTHHHTPNAVKHHRRTSASSRPLQSAWHAGTACGCLVAWAAKNYACGILTLNSSTVAASVLVCAVSLRWSDSVPVLPSIFRLRFISGDECMRQSGWGVRSRWFARFRRRAYLFSSLLPCVVNGMHIPWVCCKWGVNALASTFLDFYMGNLSSVSVSTLHAGPQKCVFHLRVVMPW